MNKPGLAAAALVLLGGAWWTWARRSSAPASSEAGSAFSFGDALDVLAAPLASLEAGAQSTYSDIVAAVTPEPVNAETNLAAFLAMIRRGEGTAGAEGYRTIFGGRLFDGYADHPRIKFTARMGGKSYTSDAAGAYQALSSTWDDFIRSAGPHDFSPASQDEFAVWCIRRRGALADVRAGRFEAAVAKCAKEWASLPGSPYGQPTVTLADARATYEQAGGAYG